VRNESAALRIRVFNCYLQSEASSLAELQTLARTGTGKIEVFGTRYAEIGECSLFSTNQIGLQHYDTSANGTVIGGNTTPTNGGLILVDASHGPVTLTLPNPANSVPTEEFIFKKTDSTSNPVTINGGRSLIDGSGTYRLTSPYQRVQLRFADSRYYVVG
jgi:hypothetical protein